MNVMPIVDPNKIKQAEGVLSVIEQLRNVTTLRAKAIEHAKWIRERNPMDYSRFVLLVDEIEIIYAKKKQDEQW